MFIEYQHALALINVILLHAGKTVGKSSLFFNENVKKIENLITFSPSPSRFPFPVNGEHAACHDKQGF